MRRENTDEVGSFGLVVPSEGSSEAAVTERGTPQKEVEGASQSSSSAKTEQRAPVPEGQDNAAGGSNVFQTLVAVEVEDGLAPVGGPCTLRYVL